MSEIEKKTLYVVQSRRARGMAWADYDTYLNRDVAHVVKNDQVRQTEEVQLYLTHTWRVVKRTVIDEVDEGENADAPEAS